VLYSHRAIRASATLVSSPRKPLARRQFGSASETTGTGMDVVPEEPQFKVVSSGRGGLTSTLTDDDAGGTTQSQPVVMNNHVVNLTTHPLADNTRVLRVSGIPPNTERRLPSAPTAHSPSVRTAVNATSTRPETRPPTRGELSRHKRGGKKERHRKEAEQSDSPPRQSGTAFQPPSQQLGHSTRRSRGLPPPPFTRPPSFDDGDA
jgi:hypothetical protein